MKKILSFFLAATGCIIYTSANAQNNDNGQTLYNHEAGDVIPNNIDKYLNFTHTITNIAGPADGIAQPRDLDFHPILSRNELWVVLKSTPNVGGKTAKISNAGMSNQTVLVQKDGNARHFMSTPTGIAFSSNGNFCTAPGVLDANFNNGRFTGPSLWSSDPAIYAQPSGGNGSHLDMLHQCPYSMGVAWEKDNAFWIFDGYSGDLMRNDFQSDHGPGNDYHANGRIREYTDFPLAKINLDIPCHLVLDEERKWIYIVDGGNSRIVRMDITTGSQTGTFNPYGNEPLAEKSIYSGTTWSAYINTGAMQPSGIDIVKDRLIVSDYATGDILIYDCSGASGALKGKIVTGQPGIQGVKIGPDGKIWYVNYLTNEVKRVDYTSEPLGIADIERSNFAVYPNPARNNFHIRSNETTASNMDIMVTDMTGRKIHSASTKEKEYSISVNGWAKGLYLVSVTIKGSTSIQKITVQ